MKANNDKKKIGAYTYFLMEGGDGDINKNDNQIKDNLVILVMFVFLQLL